MKIVLLAGGLGTRLAEETGSRPKPMVEIGGRPILWHIMKIYSHYGFNDFIICAGYKSYVIKEYFANYFLHQSDVTFRVRSQRVDVERNLAEDWHITVVDTGDSTMTGGRILRVADYLRGSEHFALTYGDGLSNINISRLLEFHQAHGKSATVSAVKPAARFGALKLLGDGSVSSFVEKPTSDGGWINGGFFIFNECVLDTIEGDATVLEHQPLSRLASSGELMAFKHEGFWQPMDTVRDMRVLNALWETGQAPWRVW